MSDKLYLGLDQSYTSSGYCMIDENQEIVDFGTFTSLKGLDVYDRAQQITNFIIDKIIEHGGVEVINLEGLAFGMRGNATRDLAGLLFTIITTIRTRTENIECNVIAPTSLKKFATGSGKADKTAMVAAVPPEILKCFTDKNYKKTTGLRDIVDAYWLAKMAL